MAAIDGIIILDSSGRPIITSHFRAHPPSYPLLHIDAFNQALAKTKPSFAESSTTTRDELEPILWVSVPNTRDDEGGWMTAGLYHIEREGMQFLIPVSQELNPMLPFAFIYSFLETLTSYLGEVTETTIRDNFDIVYMLIEEMLDEGHPMTMETNMLKDIVLPPTLVRKLLAAAGVSGALSQTNTPFTAPISWRRPNARYSNNEIYFDIEESIDAIIDRQGKVLSSEVWGRIQSNARLTGNPDLILTFANPKIMENPAFHPCVRHRKWLKDNVLSFVPPDGHFKLLEYQVAKPTGIARPIAQPLLLKAQMSVDVGGGKFTLSLASRTHSRPLENIIISIYLGDSTTYVSATASGDSRGLISGGGGGGGLANPQIGCVGGGTWEFDPNTKVLKWSISSLTANEKAASLVGSFTCAGDDTPIPSPTFNVEFQIGQHSLSGLRVEQLKVVNDIGYKPFKGIRTFVKNGRYEVRW